MWALWLAEELGEVFLDIGGVCEGMTPQSRFDPLPTWKNQGLGNGHYRDFGWDCVSSVWRAIVISRLDFKARHDIVHFNQQQERRGMR